MKKKDWLYFLLLAVLFGVFFYFVGEDSPLHDIFYSRDHIDRRDTPWFFTCGKALMNGMVPYVEFADSKGPLLWLIYGLAYLISPHDYFGVWIINGIGYLGVLLCMYLTVKMFVKKEGVAFLLTLLTVPFLFIPDIHYETKSEDSALIFIALSFWQCVRILYEEKLTDKDWWRAFFLWGLCFGGTLLIKYNSSLMIAVFLAFMLIRLYQEKRRFWPHFWWAVGGAAAIVLPFVIFLACRGALWAFIDDYFIQTPQTIANLKGSRNYFLQMIVDRPDFRALLEMFLIGGAAAWTWLDKWKFFPLAVTAWFTVMILTFARGYYIIICGPLMVFLPLALYFCIKKHTWPSLVALAAIVAIFSVVGYRERNWYTKEYFGTPKTLNERRKACHAMNDYIASRAHKPKILYYGCSDKSYGMASEALPACRYWSQQGGATKRMNDDQHDCVAQRRADFVFVKQDAKNNIGRLEKAGYRKVKLPPATKFILYERGPQSAEQ
ncbi:MAG: phospholipid carrier-dependent glycosyltransferase [Bacteroidales bacterium]|nr:phospholipid carrier-dependent glycosyltransferase [Bacteroidales bacterium]